LVDGLWNQARAKEREIQALRVDFGLLANILEDKRAALKTASQAQRQAAERPITGESVEAVRLRWLRDLAELRLRHAEAVLGTLESEREFKAATLAYRVGEGDLLRRKAVTAQRMSPLSQEDRDAKLATLAAEQRALRGEAERAAAGEQKAQDALQAARNRLSEVRQRSVPEDAAPPAPELARLQQELDTSKAEADVASSNLKILRLLDQGNGIQQQMWGQRYQLEQVRTPQAIDGAMAHVQTGLERIKQFRAYFLSELDLMQRRTDGQHKRLAAWQAEDGDRRLAERTLRAYQSGEAMLGRALAKAEEIEASLGNWQESMRLERETVSVAERLRGLYAELGDRAGRFWHYELVAVEDKILVEGREIVGKRSVTLGQILQMLLILVVGLWLAGYVADRGREIMFRRYPGKESSSLLIYRIFSLGAVVGLVVFALVTVNIPLTVFAFVGGALALGVGFGAQNIINNFISGLILLVERPIKVGDIVEVDGVRGRVATIGSRCCQVRRFDGIDMLVPNSSFLEKNVTNWTLSDQQLRFSITLSVVYGSAIRHVMELLRRAVDEHPKVGSEPAPEVYMQNFGESALEFRIDFWLDIRLEPNWQQVVSDVRVRIDELFHEAGLVIAFPQRDVHLDVAAPIRVEWVAPPGPPDREANPSDQGSRPPPDGAQSGRGTG
jgi:potassium efflux system protein